MFYSVVIIFNVTVQIKHIQFNISMWETIVSEGIEEY